MKKYDLLIFDWDGTLADSLGGIVAAMQVAIEALDLPARSDQQIGELIGLGFQDGLSRLYPELDAERIRQMIEGYRRRISPSFYGQMAPLFDGAESTLRQLSEGGYQLAVATGKSRTALDHALRAEPQLSHLFHATRCADETADKPDPAMLYSIVDDLGVDADRCLMIGDTEYDMAMAASMGMAALGVACGGHDPARLMRTGAKAVISDISSLPSWLRSEGS